MYFHRDKYNVAITKLGGVPLDISTECVWSSSLCSYAEGSYWHSDDIFWESRKGLDVSTSEESYSVRPVLKY